jgi:hypothetical protein
METITSSGVLMYTLRQTVDLGLECPVLHVSRMIAPSQVTEVIIVAVPV